MHVKCLQDRPKGWEYVSTSPSLSFQGPLIYVNYGREEDFAHLEKLGIEVAGAIVLMRYSKASRSSKVRHDMTLTFTRGDLLL